MQATARLLWTLNPTLDGLSNAVDPRVSRRAPTRVPQIHQCELAIGGNAKAAMRSSRHRSYHPYREGQPNPCRVDSVDTFDELRATGVVPGTSLCLIQVFSLSPCI